MKYSLLPLVSMESLTALEESLEGQTAMSRGFVSRFIELWPQRFSRLTDAVSSSDWSDASESALSLFSSSTMVGAERLGQMSGDLVEILKQGGQDQVRERISDIGRCGDETVMELTIRYVQHTT